MSETVECNKEKYRNRQLAKDVVSRANAKGKRLNVYECNVCKCFHVGEALGPQVNKKVKGHYHRNRQRDSKEYYK